MNRAKSEPAYSPAPFMLMTDKSGHLIVDAMGDSIGALALRTGDHPAEEQAANANLFTASPLLLQAAKVLLRDRYECDVPVQGVSEAWSKLLTAVALAETGR